MEPNKTMIFRSFDKDFLWYTKKIWYFLDQSNISLKQSHSRFRIVTPLCLILWIKTAFLISKGERGRRWVPPAFSFFSCISVNISLRVALRTISIFPLFAVFLFAMHIHPGTNWIFLAPRRKFATAKRNKTFFPPLFRPSGPTPLMKERSSPLLRSDARLVYAISLPLDSKLPHLPRPCLLAFPRHFPSDFSRLPPSILIMKISRRVSGGALISPRTYCLLANTRNAALWKRTNFEWNLDDLKMKEKDKNWMKRSEFFPVILFWSTLYWSTLTVRHVFAKSSRFEGQTLIRGQYFLKQEVSEK